MALIKPDRPAHKAQIKAQRAWKGCPEASLLNVAAGVSYVGSPYHCRGENGERVRRRGKPASVCPKRWSAEDARAALKRAVLNGNVSEAWESDYPRYIWYREGTTIVYEARLSGGFPGSYHAYPIEADQVPRDVS